MDKIQLMELRDDLMESKKNRAYNIRSTSKLYLEPCRSYTDYGLLTFHNFYCEFFNKNMIILGSFKDSHIANLSLFKNFLFNNKSLLITNFLNIFPNFQISNLNLYCKSFEIEKLNTAFYNK